MSLGITGIEIVSKTIGQDEMRSRGRDCTVGRQEDPRRGPEELQDLCTSYRRSDGGQILEKEKVYNQPTVPPTPHSCGLCAG